MTRVFERRVQRAHRLANDLLGESKWTIWCFEPEQMPAMIDLLIAMGVLRESDRPYCLHWTAVRDSGEMMQEDRGRVLDADEILEAAGFSTLTGALGKAWREDPEAVAALLREGADEQSADDSEGPVGSN